MGWDILSPIVLVPVQLCSGQGSAQCEYTICQNNAESFICSLFARSIENTNQTVTKDRVARLEVAYQLYLMVVVVFPSLDDPCKRAHCVGKKLKTWMKWMKSYQFSEADESVQVHNKTRSTMSPRIPAVGFISFSKVPSYRPRTKLRKGNVFTPVCVPVAGGGKCTPY